MRKPHFPTISLFLALAAPTLYSEEVLVVQEDFEDATVEELSVAPNNGALLDLAEDPAGGDRGQVAVIEMSGASQWGALDLSPDQRIALAPLGIGPGVDTYELKADFYLPEDTVLVDPDTVGVITRWVGESGPEKSESGNHKQIFSNPVDEWFTLELSGPIPATFGPGTPVTHVQPIFSFRDVDVDSDPGVAVYVDNIELKAFTTGQVPKDPHFIVSKVSPFGTYLDLDPRTGTIGISNAGLENTLTISEANLIGADAAHYKIETTVPIELPPGESSEIEVTFTPGKGAGSYNAELELKSNDTTDPTLTIPLAALIVDDNRGGELIINGGFEAGNTSGFSLQTGRKFEIITDPVHSGEFAAVYEMQGGVQWGSVHVDQPSPPAPDDGPSNHVAITEDMWDQEWFFSAFYSVPEEGGITEEDQAMFIIRWNGEQPDAGPFLSVNGASLFPGEWTEYTETGIVPPEHNGNPVTSAFLILSFRDVNSDAEGGEQIYVDDWSFRIGEFVEPEPDPVPLAFTDVMLNEEARTVTLTWTSQPGETFTVSSSSNLQDWLELNDGHEAGDGTTTSYTDDTIGDDTVRYYQVRRED